MRQEEVEDITKVSFQRKVSFSEVGKLFRYVTFHLSGNVNTQLHTSYLENFGGYGNKSRSLEELPEYRFNEKLSGIITRLPPMSNVEFSVESTFNGDEKIYTGLQFLVTSDDEPEELPSDDTEIMRETKQIIDKYFTEFPVTSKLS